ncbi:MAG TPA: hypothetical protein VMN57_10155 [Anaerolineales bacterium]|nr:hypothetical protein [Anaerolineales bacterium]
MDTTNAFSIDVPRRGVKIDIVEFNGDVVRSPALVSVRGPFPTDPHDAYICVSQSGEKFLIYHLQPGEPLDGEEIQVRELIECKQSGSNWPS